MTRHFAKRTLEAAIAFGHAGLMVEEFVSQKGFLQGVDARVKLFIMFGFLFSMIWIHSREVMGIGYGIILFLALISKIPLGYFLKRTWILIAFFSLLTLVPSIFSVVSPGEVIVRLGALQITREGVEIFLIMAGRVINCVSMTVLISLTTRHFELFKALSCWGVPSIFLMVLEMAYRYLQTLVQTLEETHRSIQSRIGWRTVGEQGRRIVGWGMASLWIRSYAMSEDVHQAMRSRGYSGRCVSLHAFKMRGWDWVVLVGSVCVFGALIVMGRGGA